MDLRPQRSTKSKISTKTHVINTVSRLVVPITPLTKPTTQKNQQTISSFIFFLFGLGKYL